MAIIKRTTRRRDIKRFGSKLPVYDWGKSWGDGFWKGVGYWRTYERKGYEV